MIQLRRAMLRLRAILGRRTLDDDMQAEMRQHLERATERLVGRGMSHDEARLAARREFGNVTVLQEESRDARGARWVDALKGDLRFAFRYFARHKATVAIIITVLALGTGANTVIFSIFQSEFLRPAPAVRADAAQARIWAQERTTRTARWQTRPFTHAELLAFAQRRELFSDVAAWTEDEIVLDARDSTGARALGAQFVTTNYFAVLGVPLVAGQGLVRGAADGPADLTAVISHLMATRLYGDAAVAVGSSILVNEVPLRIVGVAPPRFQGAMKNMDEPALWIPLSARAEITRISPRWLNDEAALSLFARMAPAASHEQATALARQVVASTLPDSAARVGMTRTAIVQAMRSPPPGSAKYELILAFTFLAVLGGLILLVAWMNVSSLMVAAAVGRRHEIAVRLSLGASRFRLLRQLVTESTVLAIAGGGVGLLLAWWTLMRMQTTEIDGVTVAPDVGTFAFTLAIALATGILFGLSPALHATRGHVATALRDSKAGSSGRSRLQRTFVAVQIMLSQPLLVLLGTMLAMVIADYKPMSPEMSRHVISVSLRPLTGTGAPRQRREAVDSLAPRIAQLPDVVGAVQDATGFDVRRIIAPDRQVRDETSDSVPTMVNVEGAAPGWFALVDVPIILGRDVSFADTAAADYPIVIGSDLARRLWGDANPVGRRLLSPVLVPGQDSIAMTVVGVFDASRALPTMTFAGGAAKSDIVARVYTAHGKQWRRDRILVRTRAPAEPFLTELQQFIRAEAPSLPVTRMRTLEQVDAQEYLVTLRMSALAGAGGALALLLASLGLYGVVSLAVQQRTREIGIRIAVGAHPQRVARMFLASGVRVGAFALLVGLPLSIAALKVALSQGIVIAPEVNVWAIGIGIAVILMAVASAATWLPARRAALVDPATTLRAE
jgi:predicted permease